ncbi:MAG: glycosyltransferase family 2 protein [Clostridia bacterium]|nr:glycosyltransferase family 2 protein [Clostridia bacterium]
MTQFIRGLISVIMPVYNAEKTLAHSAESVLQQSYGEIELILINDGSRDSSLSLCRAIAAGDGRVRVIDQTNAGPAAARNKGLDAARGEFIMFADSDDFFTPDAFRTMIAAVAESDLAIAHYYFDLGNVSSPRGLLKGDRRLTEDEFLKELMQRPGSFYFSARWNKIYRAELIQSQNIRFDPFLDWGEDFAFNMHYNHGVKAVALVEAPVYHYVKTPGSTSMRTLLNVVHSCRIKARLYRCFRGLYEEKGLYQQNKRVIDRYIYNVTLAD